MTNQAFDRRAFFGLAGTTAVGAMVAASMGTGTSKAAKPAVYQVSFTPAEWKQKLGPARFNILRQEGTERPYSSPLNKEKRRGIFTCAGCDLPVFASTTKYDSGTGWPSFFAAIPRAVLYKKDNSLLMNRTEEHCRRCGGHLGHVFDDGPEPTGKRHCINGLSLNFRPA